ELQTCLSVCLISTVQWLRTSANCFPNGSQRRRARVYRAAGIYSRHTYKQSGPTFGFNGALRLELGDRPEHPSYAQPQRLSSHGCCLLVLVLLYEHRSQHALRASQRKSIPDTHTSSLRQLPASPEPCALS
ncbi:unnamed protein product, partial [Laminaria digitata]